MKEELELKEVFQVEPAVIYHAWLDSESHSNMTGGEATSGSAVGDVFSAWDGYITGKNVALIEDEKIVQSWRTSEFAEDDEDSLLTITLTKVPEGTEVVLTHTNIPEGQTQYEKGWLDHYFAPMRAFFRG
ncbi:MAG: SRPBCC domain-containing protein [Bacteroidia bacterium]